MRRKATPRPTLKPMMALSLRLEREGRGVDVPVAGSELPAVVVWLLGTERVAEAVLEGAPETAGSDPPFELLASHAVKMRVRLCAHAHAHAHVDKGEER